jgi:hypothetical protein
MLDWFLEVFSMLLGGRCNGGNKSLKATCALNPPDRKADATPVHITIRTCPSALSLLLERVTLKASHLRSSKTSSPRL